MTTKILERRDDVISLRQSGLTFKEIGRRLGISKQRVGIIVKGKPIQKIDTLESKVMLKTNDVASLLSIHANTVRRWSNKGVLKSYHIGPRGDRRFPREEIDNFLADHADSRTLEAGVIEKDESQILTERQLQLIYLASEGLTNELIGSKLGISSQTVKNTFSQMLKHTQAKSKTHLVAMALKNSWIR